MQEDAAKRQHYLDVLARYALFVTEGCITAPTNPNVGTAACPPHGLGWVIPNGKDKGAVGDGWYEKMLNSEAYTISTATTGSCALPAMAALPGLQFDTTLLDNIAEVGIV